MTAIQWLTAATGAVVGGAGAYGICLRLGWQTPNFQGRPIPASVGFGLLGGVVGLPLVQAGEPTSWAVVLLLLAFGLLGLLDDRKGNAEFRGFRGHLRALRGGRLTTGAVKLLGGGVAALVYGFHGAPDLGRAVLTAGVIALGANALNLLDCRPSRALKGWWLLTLGTAAFQPLPPVIWALLLATLCYAPLDFGCRAMLGDAGANPLGAALGAWWAASCSWPTLLALLLVLSLLHVLTEKYSLSRLIESNPTLRRLDGFGVCPPESK